MAIRGLLVGLSLGSSIALYSIEWHTTGFYCLVFAVYLIAMKEG